ncbi:MAG TPA: hypothetical protein VNO54_06540 [Streptosporangiaceae bacterium]|nr:hypothetical protein [Streptosporangiaceae bacterium]
MTASHGSPPLGSAARDATAAPYVGRHRTCGERSPILSLKCKLYGDQPHQSCSGTCDCGGEHRCEHWCHEDSPWYIGGMSHREDRVRDQNGDDGA